MDVPTHHSLLSGTVIAILPLFVLMAAGVVVRRARILDRAAGAALTRFALDVAVPALILHTLLTKQFNAAFFLLPVTLWAAQAVAILVLLPASKLLKMNRHETGASIFSMFGNTSFLGFPITTALFPNLLSAAVILDQFGMWLVLNPASVVVGHIFGEGDPNAVDAGVGRRLLQQMKSPLLIALCLGLSLRGIADFEPNLLQGPVAQVWLYALQMLGAAAIPVIMVALGMRLSAGAARRYIVPISALATIKLIVMPVVCYGVGRFALNLHGSLLSVAVLESAMPPAATSVVFAAQYRLNSDLAVATFFVLTVASAVTVPLAVSILQ